MYKQTHSLNPQQLINVQCFIVYVLNLSKPEEYNLHCQTLLQSLLKRPSSFSPGPPSAPVNVISSVNGTSVNLEWDRPLDTGGRSDLQYSVFCQKCSREGGPCEDCTSSPGATSGGKAGGAASIGAGGGAIVERSGTAAVKFIPRQSGLTEPWVTVLNLVAHTNYSFRIMAINAVTHLSNEVSPYVTVNITTNQAGEFQSMHVHLRQDGDVWLSLGSSSS